MEENKDTIVEETTEETVAETTEETVAETEKDRKKFIIPIVAIAALALIAMIAVLIVTSGKNKSDDDNNEPATTDYVQAAKDYLNDGDYDKACEVLVEQINNFEENGIEDTQLAQDIVNTYVDILKGNGEDVLADAILSDMADVLPEVSSAAVVIDDGETKDGMYIYGAYPSKEVTAPYLTYSVINAQYGSDNTATVGSGRYYRLDGDKYRYFVFEKITWQIMKNDQNGILLLADKAIETAPYNDEYADIGWDGSTLRKFLNNDFLNMAFSEDEKNAMQTINVIPVKNPDYGVVTGAYVDDFVTIPSIDDLVDGIYSIKEGRKDESVTRSSTATEYACAKGTHLDTTGKCKWWTRTCGVKENMGSFVGPVGIISCDGYYVNGDEIGVKPMIYIKK